MFQNLNSHPLWVKNDASYNFLSFPQSSHPMSRRGSPISGIPSPRTFYQTRKTLRQHHQTSSLNLSYIFAWLLTTPFSVSISKSSRVCKCVQVLYNQPHLSIRCRIEILFSISIFIEASGLRQISLLANLMLLLCSLGKKQT